MDSTSPLRHISDTALWVAVYRAQESQRTDAVFRDPYAGKLAGERGIQIAAAMPFARRHSWSYTARTWLVDQVITRSVLEGTDMIVNLAAGLDSRPYRMQLPGSLRWIEVDLPDMLSYKQEILAAERPVCELDRVPLEYHFSGGDASSIRLARTLVELELAAPKDWETAKRDPAAYVLLTLERWIAAHGGDAIKRRFDLYVMLTDYLDEYSSEHEPDGAGRQL